MLHFFSVGTKAQHRLRQASSYASLRSRIDVVCGTPNPTVNQQSIRCQGPQGSTSSSVHHRTLSRETMGIMGFTGRGSSCWAAGNAGEAVAALFGSIAGGGQIEVLDDQF